MTMDFAITQKGNRMDDLISRRAAIDDLYGRDPSQIWDTADIEVWINALPSAEVRTPMSSADCISRQAAIDAVLELIEARRRWASDARGEINGLDAAMCEINNLPSAQPSVSDCLGCNCPKMERLKEQKTFSEMVRLHDAETHCGAYMRGGEK